MKRTFEMANPAFPPAKVLAKVAKEIRKITQEGIFGVTLEETDNLTDIRARIDGPEGTPYEGGVFVIRLQLPSDFPHAPPKGFFLTKVFHPNIRPETGEICVDTLKRDWNPKHGIRHLLLVIRCLLIHPNPESALNEDAGKLLLRKELERFNARARLFTKLHAMRAPKQQSKGPQASSLYPTRKLPRYTSRLQAHPTPLEA